jgi:LysR family transcriptional regulator, chromosome initiation inhibitor
MRLLSPQLLAFLAVCQHKTVHTAAKHLYLTQTAVTQRIKALEKQLNTCLFTRTRRGMLPTPEAAALLRYCNATQMLEGETLAEIQGLDTASFIQLTLTGPTSLMRARVIPQCAPVMQRFPRLLLHFNFYDEDNGATTLRTGKSHFVILKPENAVKEMRLKKLKPEEYVLVACKAWADRPLENIIQQERIIDFNPSDPLTFNYLKRFDLFKHARHDRHFSNHPESIADLISQGLGYGLLTKAFSKPYVEQGKLVILNQGEFYQNPHVLAWYERPEAPDYFVALIDAIG